MSKIQNVFLIVIAVVFFASSVAFVALVIMSDRQRQKESDVVAELQKKQQEESKASSCQIGSDEGAPAEAEPEVFKPEADVTELSTVDLSEGTGDAVKAGDCLRVKYHGTLASDGTKFDGNFDTTKFLQFELGAGQVIPGWDQGVVGMKQGGMRRIVIPSELAYGDRGQGSIPANADLVFVVKLVEVVKSGQ